MNLYFIVEGRRTEYRLYPEWLKHLVPNCHRVSSPSLVEKDNYYLMHGQGVPQLYKFVNDAILEINELGVFDFLVICLDAEDSTPEMVRKDLFDRVADESIKPRGFEIKVVVQNRCIETWFLGNRKVFQKNPDDSLLLEYISHYDVSSHDPETMPLLDGRRNHAEFHLDYLKRMLANRNIDYTKVNPREVTEQHYLQQLILRTQETNHLPSLADFLAFCQKVNP